MWIEMKSLYKSYTARGQLHVPALAGVDLTIQPGEDVAVIGESGCGKTTLARVLMGLIRPDQGEILLEGERVWGNPVVELKFRRMARMVFQDPFASLDPRFTVRAILDEALYLDKDILREGRSQLRNDCLSAVSLSQDILDRYPHQFSGGERQRISLARALMSAPRLLVLDEAVSSLDVLIRKDILECLESLRKSRDITYFFITHDLNVARLIGKKIAVMYAGKIVECGTGENVLAFPRHEYTKQLLGAL